MGVVPVTIYGVYAHGAGCHLTRFLGRCVWIELRLQGVVAPGSLNQAGRKPVLKQEAPRHEPHGIWLQEAWQWRRGD